MFQLLTYFWPQIFYSPYNYDFFTSAFNSQVRVKSTDLCEPTHLLKTNNLSWSKNHDSKQKEGIYRCFSVKKCKKCHFSYTIPIEGVESKK